MIKAIKNALENRQYMYWQSRGLFGLQLRAVTYTWENGRERTKCLKEFDVKEEIESIISTHMELREKSDIGDFELREILWKAFYSRAIDKFPEILKETI